MWNLIFNLVFLLVFVNGDTLNLSEECMEYQQQLCSCGKHSADTSADGAEISGAHAERNPFSHVVHLGYGENITSAQWLCEGSLISRRFVITAGHCAGGPRTGQVKYAAFGVIRSDLKNEELIYNVKRIMRHPDFRPPRQRNDIALLEIDRNIVFSPRIQPACLNVDIEVETDEGSTTSWMLGNMEDSADTLQEVKLYKFSNQECNRQYSSKNARIFKIDDVTQTCYGYRTTPSESCKGDSGGPLVIRNKFQCLHSIIGLTSIGSVCSGTEKPGVYTKVYPYLSWIEDIVWPTMLK
ncbi:serine protease snake-like [Achroia grisella]|uniref:serine protease snake-like n=1 Tax=Achroia grisella TaxID=688607 RepID=UPI0027D1EEE4|nr:serine protease snake-like [Achroia grisella]